MDKKPYTKLTYESLESIGITIDPTIHKKNKKRYVNMVKDGQKKSIFVHDDVPLFEGKLDKRVTWVIGNGEIYFIGRRRF